MQACAQGACAAEKYLANILWILLTHTEFETSAVRSIAPRVTRKRGRVNKTAMLAFVVLLLMLIDMVHASRGEREAAVGKIDVHACMQPRPMHAVRFSLKLAIC